MSDFNANKYMTQLKGKDYLPVPARILWFRTDHPNGGIGTEVISTEPVLVKASIYDSDGKLMATGHAGAVDKGNAVWSGRNVEKAETAAIGRALGAAGYGTLNAGAEFDDSDHLSGSPQERRQNAPQGPQSARSTNAAPPVTNGGNFARQPDVNPMALAFAEVVELYDMVQGDAGKKNAFRDDVKHLIKTGVLTEQSTAPQIVSAVKFYLLPKPVEVVK